MAVPGSNVAMRLTKRKFLVSLAAGATIGVVMLEHYRFQLRQFAFSFRPERPHPGPTGALAPVEMEAIVALTEILVDARELSDEEREHIRRHVQDRTENDPGYLGLFQSTAAHLDQIAGGTFASKAREERERIARNDGLLAYRMRNREYLSPFGRKKRLIRALAVPDLIGGYYRSAAGWAVVGYSTFPGRCSYLTRYTRPEA
jgi:hypothetical protein